MTTNFLYAQAPNRKGNIGKLAPSHSTGVTGASGPQHGTATPKGNQGAPAYARATDNQSAGVTAGRKQKVMVDTHATYCGTIKNDGYMDKSTKNYLG
jgi:hypothetical protein